jgi:hypothetical protein
MAASHVALCKNRHGATGNFSKKARNIEKI